MALVRGARCLRGAAASVTGPLGAGRRWYSSPCGNLEHLGTLSTKPNNIPLQKGDFFINKLFKCRSVVLRVDPRCMQDDTWCRTMGVSKDQKEQPFYLCLGDQRDTNIEHALFYVAHQYAIPYKSAVPLENKWTPFFLKGFSGGKHVVKNDMVISL